MSKAAPKPVDLDALDLCGDLGHAHPIPGATVGDYVKVWRRARERVLELERIVSVRCGGEVPARLSDHFAGFAEIVRRFEADPDFAKRLGGQLAPFLKAWEGDRTRTLVLDALLAEATVLMMEAERELGEDELGEWSDDAVVDRWLADVRRWIRDRKAAR